MTIGPVRLNQIAVPMRNDAVWMNSGGDSSGFLLWNATDYLLISGTDRFQISL